MVHNQSLPPMHDALEIFHKYADPLRALPRSSLPKRQYLSVPEQNLIERCLSHHHHATKKIGCGVRRIFVERNLERSSGYELNGRDTCCFFVQRSDGSEEDFSILKAYGRGGRNVGYDGHR
jgi:hypothetical protein